MSILKSKVDRIYLCNNSKCNCEILLQEKVTQNFRKKCPFCYKLTLSLKSASSNISLLKDIKKVKTLGSIVDKNAQMAETEGKFKKKKRPPWRNKKLDLKILQNPKNYILHGRI